MLALHHLLPLANENRWTDVLAVLVEADPVAASAAFGLYPPLRSPVVRREVVETGRDRLDLLVDEGGRTRALVEAKVLSGVHGDQLRRYRDRRPGAERYLVLCLARLPVDVSPAMGWDVLTWEHILDRLSVSSVPWVAQTASEWRSYLDTAVPAVDGQTRWNDLQVGEDFVLAMRARMLWVFDHLQPPAGAERRFAMSSAGVSWICKMDLPAKVPGYFIRVEAEERLPVQSYPKRFSQGGRSPQGPTVRVCLAQTGVRTSSGFDWEYLLQLWPLMDEARKDWVTNRPRLKAAHDKAGYHQIVAKGAPVYVGVGFGEGQAKKTRECWFGARFQLPPSSTLAEVASELAATTGLMLAMADVSPAHAAVLGASGTDPA